MYPYPVRVVGLSGEATTGQIELAEKIHKLLGAELPTEKTKQKYSDYINKHVVKYRKATQEGLG